MNKISKKKTTKISKEEKDMASIKNFQRKKPSQT